MDEPEDSRQAEMLDAYLSALQAGQRPDREALLAACPELASALDCLERLKGLAPEVEEAPLLLGRPPREFGGYEILDEIGRGGMGVVYRARQVALDRIVALKMILGSQLASAEHVRRFQTEARSAARLRHPNIVPIHEVGEYCGQHFFAMEYIEGESLASRLAREPMKIETGVQIVAAVARAVAHLHREGLIHRDLKPGNILLDLEGRPYVTDFGLAKVLSADSQQTSTGVIAGTPSYMAPEQAACRQEAIGPASDIYSLGAILYEILTARPPFREQTPLETLLQVIDREPLLPRRLNRHVPRGLELICLRCLAKSPADRYASADELADDLERFLCGETLSVRPPSLVQGAAQWSRRKPALAGRLIAFVLFYAVETMTYLRAGVTAEFHVWVTGLLIAWTAGSIFCQRLLEDRRWATHAQYLWGMLDVTILLATMLLADGVASRLVVALPLLIAGAALWFRVRFVWFITGLALAAYGVLVIDFYQWRPSLQKHFDPSIERHVLFAVALLVMGTIVSYLVLRIRVLSSFYRSSRTARGRAIAEK